MDLSLDVGRRFADARGIKALADFDELLGAVNVVDICSPPDAHEEQIVGISSESRAWREMASRSDQRR